MSCMPAWEEGMVAMASRATFKSFHGAGGYRTRTYTMLQLVRLALLELSAPAGHSVHEVAGVQAQLAATDNNNGCVGSQT